MQQEKTSIISSNKTIAKNSIFLAVRMVFVMLISVFTTRYLLANLGVVDYGVYNVTLGIVIMCTFLSPSLTNAIQRYYNYELGKSGTEGARQVFNSGIIIQALMAILIIVVCESIGLWYVINHLVVPAGRKVATMWVYQISIIAIALSMLQVPFVASIMAHEKMNFYAIINVIDAVLKLLIAILIKYSNFDNLIFYGFLLLGVYIFDFLSYSTYCFLKFKDARIKISFDKGLLRSIGAFTGWNLFETIARMLKDQGCNLLFNFYFGPIINAARGVSNQVTYAFSSIVESTIMASRPQMVQSYAIGDVNKSLNMFYTLSKGTIFLIFILSLPFFIEIDFVLKLWLGDSVPEYTSLLIRLSIIVTLFDKLASPVTALIHATGEIKRYHISSGVLNLVVLPLSCILLYIGGNIISVYILTILFTILSQIVYIIIIKNQINVSIKTYTREVLFRFLFIIPSAIIPTFIYFFMEEGYLRLAAIFTVCVICSLILALTVGLNKNERELVKSIIKR